MPLITPPDDAAETQEATRRPVMQNSACWMEDRLHAADYTA